MASDRTLQDVFRDVLREQDAPLGLCAGCVQEWRPGGEDPLPALVLAPVQMAVNGAPMVAQLNVCGTRHLGALGAAQHPPRQSAIMPGTMIPGIPLDGRQRG